MALQSQCTSPAAPAITEIFTNSGPLGGGSPVGLTGSGFCSHVLNVYFGTTPAASWMVISDGFMHAVSPAHTAGTIDIIVASSTGLSGVTAADQFTFAADPPSVYTPIVPRRVLDTRITPPTPNQTIFLSMFAQGVPNNATAVTLNVTVTGAVFPEALIVFRDGGVFPHQSNLNWTAGETVANLVTVGIGGVNGGVDFYFTSIGPLPYLIVDLEGYFTPPGAGTAGEFVALVPSRITDTRPGSGQANAGATLGPGSSLDVQVTGAGGVPSTGVGAVVLNATVTDTTTAGFLTVWPTGAARPLASNLNWAARWTRANRVIVPVGTGGKVSFFSGAGVADLVVDVSGYFTDATASGSAFYALRSETLFNHPRILDTRDGTGGHLGRLTPDTVTVLAVGGQGGFPLAGTPTAAVINVTVTDTSSAGALVAWPDGSSLPGASDLNWLRGQTVPNLVVVALPPSGNIDILVYGGGADVIVDALAWFG